MVTSLSTLLFLATPMFAQADGITLLAKVQMGVQANDIWGYTAPDGREYAVIGTTGSTRIYNCTDPTAPYLTGDIPGPSSLWRDIKTYDQYAYAVTEGGKGLQIISLVDPENPYLVKTWGTNQWNNAHNIACDVGEGTLWVCGTNNGTVVLDVSNDPVNPVKIGTYNSNYVHDLHVQNGHAHLSEIYGGDYRIVRSDSIPNFPTRDKIQTPGNFTHSSWANEDDTLCITTDEVGGGRVALYDISNPSDIRFKDSWTIDNRTIPHNAFIRGDRVYVSWYTEGLVCLDISDPSNIRKVGSYDTSSYGPGSGYKGAWGCYPFAPSGVVYISDMEEGLHILRIDGAAIEFDHTPLADTQDEVGPYTLTATATALDTTATVAYMDTWYRVDGGSWQTVAMQNQTGTEIWSGEIPGQVAPAVMEYYLYGTDSTGRNQWSPGGHNAGDLTYSFLVGVERVVYFDDFEGTGDGGWTHGKTSGTDDWQRGIPAGKGGESTRHEGTVWVDPDHAFSGTKVWGNDLGAGNANGAYVKDSSNWLKSPAIDCTSSTRTVLQFQRWASIEAAPYDHGRIRVNGNLVWENPQGFSGDAFHLVDNTWFPQSIDISQYADGNPMVEITFELESDGVMQLGGWQIDDFTIISLEPASGGNNTIILSGPTSAAAGATVAYQFTNAPLGSRWIAGGSFNNLGMTVMGHTFDIGMPYFEVGSGLASQGNGSFQGNIPAALAGQTVYIEIGAAMAGAIYDSNMVTLSIQ